MPRNRSTQASKRARTARAAPSVAEELVWAKLRNQQLGFKFRREHPVLNYRLDFYCAEASLAVELDGEHHDAAQDALRDQALDRLGILVLRVPNRAFFNLDGEPANHIFDDILALCESRTGRNGHPL